MQAGVYIKHSDKKTESLSVVFIQTLYLIINTETFNGISSCRHLFVRALYCGLQDKRGCFQPILGLSVWLVFKFCTICYYNTHLLLFGRCGCPYFVLWSDRLLFVGLFLFIPRFFLLFFCWNKTSKNHLQPLLVVVFFGLLHCCVGLPGVGWSIYYV